MTEERLYRWKGVAAGRVITSLYIDKEENFEMGALIIRFTDGAGFMLIDNGRQCCERRYMTTDDDLSFFVGAEFLGFEVRDAPITESIDGKREAKFLLGKTSRGTFTIETHNDHNGWYGGFAINIQEI